ncbi:XRE family transcriptional regulator [Rahnella sp. CJA17(1/100)]|uniref:XRE family transcriptional regulator n=1 Tax=Rahnella sp. CJA17(1/100) TaxID=2508951 RepID=UPI00106FE157|nr:XRE family transcriptional regulator [Rahnella sp. CJA17(1/100)]
MPNLTKFNATPSNSGVVITASYDDGTTLQFPTDAQSSEFMISIVQTLSTANERIIAAENRAAAAIRTGDRKNRRTTDSDDVPTKVDPQFMRIVRAVCPRYNEASQDDDPRLVALDVLRYAPVDAYSAVCNEALSNLQLNQSIQILEQVGDYMKANDIQPKPFDTSEAIKSVADAVDKFWGRKK